MALLLLTALAQIERRGIEITQVDVEATMADDLAVVRLSVTMRNLDPGDGQADLTITLPREATVFELDSEGPFDADVEAVLPAIEARGEILDLIKRARKFGAGTRHGGSESPKLVREELRIEPMSAYVSPAPAPRPVHGAEPGRPVDTASTRKRDPQLLEKIGHRSYRLRVYPMESAVVYAMVSGDAAIEIARDAGSEQRADILFAVPLSIRVEAGTPLEWRTLELPLAIRGTYGREVAIPRADVRVLLPECERVVEVRGDGFEHGFAGERPALDATHRLDGGALTVAVRVAPATVVTGGGASHGPECDHFGEYDEDWVLACVEAGDRIRALSRKDRLSKAEVDEIEQLGASQKLVTRWTSILRVDSALYAAVGDEAPASAPERARRD